MKNQQEVRETEINNIRKMARECRVLAFQKSLAKHLAEFLNEDKFADFKIIVKKPPPPAAEEKVEEEVKAENEEKAETEVKTPEEREDKSSEVKEPSGKNAEVKSEAASGTETKDPESSETDSKTVTPPQIPESQESETAVESEDADQPEEFVLHCHKIVLCAYIPKIREENGLESLEVRNFSYHSRQN